MKRLFTHLRCAALMFAGAACFFAPLSQACGDRAKAGSLDLPTATLDELRAALERWG